MIKNFLFQSKLLYIIIFLLAMAACSERQDNYFVGKYTLIDSSENPTKRDTLSIYATGKYEHVLYSISEKCVIYKNIGEWNQSENYLSLDSFRNNYFIESCLCITKESCRSEVNAIFVPNWGWKLKYLTQDVNILVGIKYRKLKDQ